MKLFFSEAQLAHQPKQYMVHGRIVDPFENPSLAMTLIDSFRQAPRGGAGFRPVRSELTDREWEVLDLLTSGEGTEGIARALVLSTETVRSHLKNLYRKLGVVSRAEAVRRGRELGLI